MRKGLIFLLSIVSFLGINTVSADTIDFYLDISSEYSTLLKDTDTVSILENKFYEVIDDILKEHNYYIVRFGISGNNEPYFVVYSYDTSFVDYTALVSSTQKDIISTTYYFLQSDGSYRIAYENVSFSFGPGPLPFDLNNSTYWPNNFYFSNMEIIYDSSTVANFYIDDELFFTLNRGDIIPTYKEIINPSVIPYNTINLNDYSYVALSLKDYNTIPENNSSVYTNISVKGQLCITPVYNYGQTERKDVLTGTQIQGCTQYYNDFTLTRMYILKDDVENHAIYYLKAYDTTKENYVKVDTSRFNITYITEEKKDNPEVLINGKVYPTLPYGSLTDTSTKSEEEGYVPGVSCAVGDLNCYDKYSSENIFDEVFSSPLDFLKNIWSSVTSIFDIITEFISLLPPVMQSFLYLSFMVAVAFGLIKLIL